MGRVLRCCFLVVSLCVLSLLAPQRTEADDVIYCYGTWVATYTICYECTDGNSWCEDRSQDQCDAGPPCRANTCYTIGNRVICE